MTFWYWCGGVLMLWRAGGSFGQAGTAAMLLWSCPCLHHSSSDALSSVQFFFEDVGCYIHKCCFCVVTVKIINNDLIIIQFNSILFKSHQQVLYIIRSRPYNNLFLKSILPKILYYYKLGFFILVIYSLKLDRIITKNLEYISAVESIVIHKHWSVVVDQ